MADLAIERLCGHHVVDNFRAIGDNDRYYWKVLIQRQQDYLADLPPGGLTTFVAVDNLDVVGFIDLLGLMYLDGDDRRRDYLFLPTVAVHEPYKDTAAFGLLIGRVTAWHAANDPQRTRYRGVVCAPGTNTALRKMLMRRRFVRWPVRPDDDLFLWRPFNDFRGDDS